MLLWASMICIPLVSMARDLEIRDVKKFLPDLVETLVHLMNDVLSRDDLQNHVLLESPMNALSTIATVAKIWFVCYVTCTFGVLKRIISSLQEDEFPLHACVLETVSKIIYVAGRGNFQQEFKFAMDQALCGMAS